MSYEFGCCRTEELPQLAEFCNRIFRTTRPGDMVREYPLLFDEANLENLRVARFEGRVVAHVGICLRDATLLGASIRVASIGSVGTDPAHRGQGLASRLMAQARERAVELGASLMLISGGRGLYHRLGYVEVGDFRTYSGPAGEGGEGVILEEATSANPDAAIRLYQQESARFLRPLSDWRKLLEAGRLLNYPADLLIIHRHGVIAAYAAVQHPREQPGSTGTGALIIGEFAGSRRALAAALPAIAGRYHAPAWELTASPFDTAWTAEAAARGWLGKPASFPGTLGIIDVPRFLKTIRPLLVERTGDRLEITPEGEGVRLAAGGTTATLANTGQFTALVFGGTSEEARAVPELPADLRAMVSAAFPLPLLWYGYNYV